jgi:LysR substrate binding domain
LSPSEPALSPGTSWIGERAHHERGTFCWAGLASSDPTDANVAQDVELADACGAPAAASTSPSRSAPRSAPSSSSPPIRKERLVALLPEALRLAREDAIPLSALADEEVIVFPREIAPRLHDAFVSIYRRAGFEPRVRNESFHTGGDLVVLADIPAAALASDTVAAGLPDRIVAVSLSAPTDSPETCLVWRSDDSSPAVAVFGAIARAAFSPMSAASP